MSASSSAGGKLALVLLLASALAGCSRAADVRAITVLVDRFVELLAAGDASPSFEDLEEIFTGLDESAARSLTEDFSSVMPELSSTIRSVRFLPLGGGAMITVDLRSGESTSALELRATKIQTRWRLDPSFRVRQRLDEVKTPSR